MVRRQVPEEVLGLPGTWVFDDSLRACKQEYVNLYRIVRGVNGRRNKKVLTEIQPIYVDTGKPGNVELVVHDGAHEIDLPDLLEFFDKHLGK